MCSLSAALNLFEVSILAIDWLVELCSVRTFSEEHNSVQTVNDWLIQWIQWIGNISLSPCETSFVILPPHYHFDRGIDDRCSSVRSRHELSRERGPIHFDWYEHYEDCLRGMLKTGFDICVTLCSLTDPRHLVYCSVVCGVLLAEYWQLCLDLYTLNCRHSHGNWSHANTTSRVHCGFTRW